MASNEPISDAREMTASAAAVTNPASGSGDSDGLVIYISQNCPFCMRVKGLFASFDIAPKLIDSEDPANREAYLAAVQRHQHFTVPMVLYKGKLIGGCDDTCALIERGDFVRIMDLPSVHAVTKPGQPRRDLVSPSFFNFPVLVDIKTVRATSFVVVVISILLIVFRSHKWAWWVTFGMTLDFGARMMFGGSGSMAGSLGLVMTSWMEEELVPGPPKQFAAMVGFFFYGFATILDHTGHGGHATTVGGSIMMGIIAFFAFLEFSINFCAGCFVFGYLVKFGIVKNTIYQPYTDSYEYTNFALTQWNAKVGWVDESEKPVAAEGSSPSGDKETWSWRRKLINERNRPNMLPLPRPTRVRELLAPGAETTAVDIHYKFPKFEDTFREKWSWKYLHFGDFASCMGTAGFALMVKYATLVFTVPPAAWKMAALFAAIQFGVMLLVLLAKAVLYPKKLFMDFEQPMKRNASAMVPVTFVIFSAITADLNHTLSMVMFWMGTPAIVVSAVITFVYYLRNRQSPGSYNPGILISVLGLFVSSMTIPFFVVDMVPTHRLAYLEGAKFLFGAALFFEMVYLAGTMYQGVFFHWGPDMMRPGVAIWMGAAFITSAAWVFLTGTPTFDMFAFVFFSSGILLYLSIVYLIWPGNWLLRGRFMMANWAVAFPLAVFGVAATAYWQSQEHAFAYGVCWVAWVSAGFATFTCLMHSIRLLVQRKWPGPMPECSPLMFNKLLHDGLREVQARLRLECREASTTNSDARLRAFAKEYLHLLDAHTQYEVNFMLPEFRAVNKVQVAVAQKQHEYTMEELEKLSALVDASDLTALRAALPEHLDTQYDFFQWEEDHLAPLMHKGMTQRIAVLVMERIWEHVPMEDLERFVVTTIRYLPKQMQRNMFVKAITAALPERCQQIGRWLYLGLTEDALGDIKLSLLFEDVPEIIPRGLGIAWTRQI